MEVVGVAGVLTTERDSLRDEDVLEKGRRSCVDGLGPLVAALDACRSSCGANLDAIMAETSCCGAL